jgi:hypothetical protein
MIYTTENFFNKVAAEIRQTYFANEVHNTTENKDYHTATAVMEQFNNGCLTYRKFIGRLSKSCNDTTAKIHTIVSKYVVSFGNYEYKPTKQ